MVTCLHPHVVYNKYLRQFVTVPCGKCDACTCLRSNSWTNRLELECKQHRYTIFGTLTYTDDKLPRLNVDDLSYLDGLSDMLSDSSEFISFHHGNLPFCNTKDFQKFIKNLRGYVRQFHFPQGKGLLRYFAAYEYGPTTFRPHVHYLLWFDEPQIYGRIKEFIFKSWKFANTCKTSREFFARNKTKLVDYRAASYVAGYLNCFTHLPPVLTHPDVRTKHLQSQAPPVGSTGVQSSQIRSFVLGDAVRLSVERPSTHSLVPVSLWSSFENRYLPKCPRFANLSHRDRVALYTISSAFGQVSSYKEFEQRVLCQWHDTLPLMVLLRKAVCETPVCPLRRQSRCNLNSLRRLFYLSRRFTAIRKFYGLSSSDYVERIEAYYGRKDYDSLCNQLRFEEEVASSSNIPEYDITYLPFLIDTQFYENLRHLPPSTYQLYLEQFGLDPSYDLFFRLPYRSFIWKHKSSHFHRIRSDNTKVRAKKDFVARHPEYEKIYYQNLLHNL